VADQTVTVRLRAETTAYRQGMRDARGATDEFVRGSMDGLDRSSAKMRQVGGTLTRRVTLPLIAAGAGAVKMSADFDTSMAKIVGLVGLGADEVDGMRESVMRLAGETGQAPRELADALFYITSAGLEGQVALDVLEQSARGAAAGLGDAATIADLSTSAMNAYGADVLGAAEATDTLTNAVRLGKLEPDSLAGAMGRVLPVASAMGVEFHEVGAAFAAMSRTGTGANEAATQLRGILNTILSPTEQARDALAGVGLSVEGLQTSLREDGLLATLELMVGSLGDNVTASEAVFGNIRALSGVMDMLGGNVDDTRMIFDEMTRSAGLTDEAFGAIPDHVMRSRQAFAEMQSALIELGGALAPLFISVAEVATAFASWFANLPGPARTAALAVLGIAAAAGPLLTMAGNLTRVGTGIGALSRNADTGAVSFTRFGKAIPVVTAALVVGVKVWSDYRHEIGAVQIDMADLAEMTSGQLVDGFLALERASKFSVDALETFRGVARQNTDEAERIIKALRDQGHETREYERILRDVVTGQMRQNGVTEDGIRIIEEYGGMLGGVRGHLARFRDGIGEAADSFDVLDGALEESADGLDEWRDRMRSAIGSASSRFQSFPDEVLASFEKLHDAYRWNLAEMAAWEQNVTEAAALVAEELGPEVAREVIPALMELGPGASKAIREMINASEGDRAEFIWRVVAMGRKSGDGAIEQLLAAIDAGIDPTAAKLRGLAGTMEAEENRFRTAGDVLGRATAEGLMAHLTLVSTFFTDLLQRIANPPPLPEPRYQRPDGRAAGGPTPAGWVGLVGEQGPELVQFGPAAYVHDAATTSNMLAGSVAGAPSAGGSAGVTFSAGAFQFHYHGTEPPENAGVRALHRAQAVMAA
jgi:TP901 family phage tail tape measure protein